MDYINLAKPARGNPRARVKLDGVGYRVLAAWNDVEKTYAVTLYREDGTVLRAGLPARHGEDILEPFQGSEYPGGGVGKIRVWDESGQGRDPGRDDLGSGDAVRLVYITRAEVEAAG